VPVNTLQSLLSSNPISSATASKSYQSSIDPYNVSSDNEEYLTSDNMAETIPGRSDNAAHLWAAGRLYFNQPPETPKHWGQINANLDDYHSDPIVLINTVWISDITDWWHQQEETHSRNTNLSNVSRNIFSIIPHGVALGASISCGRNVIIWSHWSKTTGETLHESRCLAVWLCQ
jgi:hypothetical protein